MTPTLPNVISPEWAAWISVGLAIILVGYEIIGHRRHNLDSVYERLEAAEEHIRTCEEHNDRCEKKLQDTMQENFQLLKQVVLGPQRQRRPWPWG